MKTVKAVTVKQYISGFPKKTQTVLNDMRTTILKAAPGAEEKISYGLPAYHLYGKPLVYFGGFQNHIGFYALPSGHAEFEKELSVYKQGKGSVQFPLSGPMPLSLVAKIVKFRMSENLKKAKLKAAK